MPSVYSFVPTRRCTIHDQGRTEGSPIIKLHGALPVLEPFGFASELRKCTSGQAFPQCTFSHWKVMDSLDPLEEGSKGEALIMDARTKKHLTLEIPPVTRFFDKL